MLTICSQKSCPMLSLPDTFFFEEWTQYKQKTEGKNYSEDEDGLVD